MNQSQWSHLLNANWPLVELIDFFILFLYKILAKTHILNEHVNLEPTLAVY